MPVRVIGLVEGDPRTALSGVGYHVLESLRSHLDVVGTIDYSPGAVERLALAAATFRPDRVQWRARFHTSRLAHRILSRNMRREAGSVGGDADIALQIHGWVSGQPQPYALFVDQTRLMAERGWPEWMPLKRGERDELLGLEREMYADAAHAFTMGLPGRASLIDDYGVDPSRVTVVGGGLRYQQLPVPHELTREPVILFVGRDFERKGGHVLLRAFELVRRKVPEATLHLVGTEERFTGPGVVSHGKVSDETELAELYAAARAFTLPSLYEPYGLVLIEAMSHGVPCVGTVVQSIPEILGDGRAGVLVRPDDGEALAGALLDLIQDDEMAQRLGESGRRRVEDSLRWEHVGARIAPVLERIAR
jgi:glycosyltransferase involved in cell wall biosynthesis